MHNSRQRTVPFSYQKIPDGLIKSAPATNPQILFQNTSYVNKTRTILFFVFLGIFAGTYQIGAMSTVSQEEAEMFMSEFEELIMDIDAFGIFLHNTTIALPMFIPGFGVAWGLFAAWSTGYAFASIVTTAPQIASIHPLSILFLSPFGLMEIVAYSLGISRSFLLIMTIVRKLPIGPLLKPTLIEIAIMISLLLAGGYLEFYMIELAQEGELAMPGFELTE